MAASEAEELQSMEKEVQRMGMIQEVTPDQPAEKPEG